MNWWPDIPNWVPWVGSAIGALLGTWMLFHADKRYVRKTELEKHEARVKELEARVAAQDDKQQEHYEAFVKLVETKMGEVNRQLMELTKTVANLQGQISTMLSLRDNKQ